MYPILVRDLAKKISERSGETVGERQLYKMLRDDGYIIKDGRIPTKKAHGLLKLVSRQVQLGSGLYRTVDTTMVTEDGEDFFVNLYGGDDIPF